MEIKRILAGVKHPLEGNAFIQSVIQIAVLQGASHVTFLYVTDKLSDINFPVAEGKSSYESLMLAFQERVQMFAEKATGIELSFEIREGAKDEILLQWAKSSNADLVILGRRSGKLGSNSRSIKVARLAPCHVLLIPETHVWKPVRRVLIPMDFSPYANIGLQVAKNIPQLQDAILLHVYDVPAGYYYTGLSETEAEARMLKNARDSYEQFMKSNDIGNLSPVPAFLLNKSGTVAETILDYARNQKAEMMIVGSKGLTGAIGFILGSVSQDLIRNQDEIPVLIVKRKDEKLSLLDALIA
jgi:nucleotide-binding universal stress UspA family protein